MNRSASIEESVQTSRSLEETELIDIIEEHSTSVELLETDDIIEINHTLSSPTETRTNDGENSVACFEDLIIVDPMAQVAESQEANYTQCCGCVQNFASYEELLNHSQLYHKSHRGICGPAPDNLIECSICYKMFSGIVYLDSMHRLNAFKNRLNSVGFPEVMQCCSCETLCTTREELLQHSNKHINNKTEADPINLYECEICFKKYSKKHTLNFHQKFGFSYKKQLTTKSRGCRAIKKRIEIEGSGEARKCCGCSAEFVSADSLKQHSQMHHELYRRKRNGHSPFECEICYKQFPTQIRLEQHRLIPYMLRHKCTKCNKSFRSLSVLAKHMGKHGPLKGESSLHRMSSPKIDEAVQCEECGKILRNKYNLRVHLKSHSQEKPFSCSLCSRQFKWKHMLQNHLRVHTKEQPYSCSSCQRSFTQLADKNRHELSHSKAYPLRCSVCGKGFPAGRKKLLLNHEKVHEAGEEYPYTCQFCDRTFTRLPQRNRHQARHISERNKNIVLEEITTT